jgi:hypothetical protein
MIDQLLVESYYPRLFLPMSDTIAHLVFKDL